VQPWKEEERKTSISLALEGEAVSKALHLLTMASISSAYFSEMNSSDPGSM
jgi:hypothetical protein